MNPSFSQMQASPSLPASVGASPFQFGGDPLFKTAGKEPVSAPPINSAMGMSPFAIAGATPTNAPLTVGDVIGLLPPEIVRAGALPAEQPLSLPPALLDSVLRSGQAALPVFELFRVCPALFQAAISPQDPRMVPLPSSKLPGLIVQAREGQAAAGKTATPPASPFALVQPPPTPAPPLFQVAAKSEHEASAGQSFPMSPFAVAGQALPADGAVLPATPSIFSVKAEPAVASSGPFVARQDAPPASPFSMTPAMPAEPVAAPAAASPFSMAQPGVLPHAATARDSSFTPASPQASSPQGSITSLFTAKSPEGVATTPAPAAAPPGMAFDSPFAAAMKAPEHAPAAAPQPAPSATPVIHPTGGGAGGVTKFGFAAVLAGYSVEELGFNPAMVPAWITTGVPASTLSEQISSGNVIIELGALVDGLSDVGFRNTLSAAKRDFRVRLPQNEVFHALTTMSAPPASPLAPQQENLRAAAPPANNALVIQPGAPAGQVARVDPVDNHAPFAAPVMQAFSSQGVQASPHPLTAFASQPPAGDAAAAPSLFAPKSGAALNPFVQQTQFPAAPAETMPAAPLSQPFGGAVSFGFTQQPAQIEPATQPGGLVRPPAGIFQPPGNSPSFQTAPVQAPLTKPLDPFAAAAHQAGLSAAKAPQDTGLSSAELLGQFPAPSFPSQTVPQTSGMSAAPSASFFKPAPSLDESPPVTEFARTPASSSLFGSPSVGAPLFSGAAPATSTAPLPVQPPAAPARMTPVKHSFLGLSPVDTQTDQLLLRALLGTEENLAAPRVVELLASQGGLSSCVCLHGSHVLSHADASKPGATEFQRQAPDIARQLRGLAPLIGIDGAETFTLNAGGRLLTFCFPGSTTVAVLHDDEPSVGLRDKITLIARELARMLG